MSDLAPIHFPDFDELGQALREAGYSEHELIARKAVLVLETFGLPDSARALVDPTVPQAVKEQIKSNLYKIGGLDMAAKIAASGQQAGSGFSINLVINSPVGATLPTATSSVSASPPVIETTAVEVTTPPATSFKVPDFLLTNNDLKGGL